MLHKMSYTNNGNKHMQQDNELIIRIVEDKIIPKRAFTKLAWWTVVVFLIMALFFILNTSSLWFQLFILIYTSPLVLVALVLSYYFGLTLSKSFYNKGRNVLLAFPTIILIQVLCVVVCLGIEVLLAGYPFRNCFDTCVNVETITVVRNYCLSSTLLFIPAYYVVPRYYYWMKFYKKLLKQKEEKMATEQGVDNGSIA